MLLSLVPSLTGQQLTDVGVFASHCLIFSSVFSVGQHVVFMDANKAVVICGTTCVQASFTYRRQHS